MTVYNIQIILLGLGEYSFWQLLKTIICVICALAFSIVMLASHFSSDLKDDPNRKFMFEVISLLQIFFFGLMFLSLGWGVGKTILGGALYFWLTISFYDKGMQLFSGESKNDEHDN